MNVVRKGAEPPQFMAVRFDGTPESAKLVWDALWDRPRAASGCPIMFEWFPRTGVLTFMWQDARELAAMAGVFLPHPLTSAQPCWRSYWSPEPVPVWIVASYEGIEWVGTDEQFADQYQEAELADL